MSQRWVVDVKIWVINLWDRRKIKFLEYKRKKKVRGKNSIIEIILRFITCNKIIIYILSCNYVKNQKIYKN